ncbi:hypothetical protein V5F44_15950 [Xanthobacter sp. V2C-8]|uniref:hypothetical protein n=1 Tax=Xanthobacter albus TaxID=3119929 RepID=UPI00372813D0
MERMERTQRTASTAAAALPLRGLGGGRGWDRMPGAPAWDALGDGGHGGGFGGGTHPAEVEALRSEIEELKARLAQAAPRRAMVEMDRAITLLHHRVEDMRGTGVDAGREEMAYLAEELLELRTALDAVRAPERFQALHAGVEMLSRKVDLLAVRSVDPVEVARLQAQSSELKSLVVRAVSGAGLQPIAERLAACAEDVSRTSAETARRVAEATSAFARNAEELITRVSAYEASVREEQSTTANGLRRDVEAGMHGIHDRLDKVGEYLSSLGPAVGAELSGHIAELAARLEGARGGEAGAGPLAEVVERHLMALTDRFQDAHARLERLDGIEKSLSQVMEEMRRVRDTSGGVSQEAVDAAVEAVSRKVSADAQGPAVVGLKRGLAALEARQDEVERRASELLGENLASALDERTVVLGRAGEDLWVPHPPEQDVVGETHEPGVAFGADGREDHDRQAAWPPEAEEPVAAAASWYQEAPEPAVHDAATQDAATQAVLQQEPLHQEPLRQEPFSREPFAQEPLFREAPSHDPFAHDPMAFRAAAYDEPAPAEPLRAEPFHAEPPHFEPRRAREAEPFFATAASDLWGEPSATGRAKKITRGRGTPADVQGEARGKDARPRADRRGAPARRPLAARLSPAVIAAAAVAVLATASVAAAWSHREAIASQALQVVARLQAGTAPALKPVVTGEAPRSTAGLPTPTGPQALRTAALEGNLAAAYEVGVRLADGVGIAPDIDAGIKWLGYAVSRGYAPAGYRLGSLYENTLHNMDEAYRYYKWAAEQGNVRAMHNLAVLYSQGIDGPPDWNEALKWFRKAANLGLKDSQHNLGIIFARGFSGTSDLTEALTWFNIAARQGDQDSAEKRDALAREADQQVLASARKAADAFVPKPLDQVANVVTVPPEWNASEAGEHIAANNIAGGNVLFSGNLLASKR